jgi:hypothetical protein
MWTLGCFLIAFGKLMGYEEIFFPVLLAELGFYRSLFS